MVENKIMINISYLITSHNEVDTLARLLAKIETVVINTDDEVIILDDYSDKLETIEILNKYSKNKPNFKLHHNHLENDYGAHKNRGISLCKDNNWIFQLDGDEFPSDLIIGDNLKQIIEANNVEAIGVPRINDFRGVTNEIAKNWGWRLTISKTYNRLIVNFPDFQFRAYKKDYPRISYKRRLHEKIEGYKSYIFLPAEEEYALHHDKTIEKQLQTNLRYNERFTVEENKGHQVS